MACDKREAGESGDGFPATAYHDKEARTLTTSFGPRAEEAACAESNASVVLMKNSNHRVIGLEVLMPSREQFSLGGTARRHEGPRQE